MCSHRFLLLLFSEWARNDRWFNWKGVEFSGWKEFKYVTGVAVYDLDENQKCTRDKGHGGWTVDKFCARIDDYVRTTAHNKGKWDAQLLEREEVLAIRLYTGPAYQPINDFLREVSKLGPEWRRQLARSHHFTYTATVCHLCDGLRKLVSVGTEVSTGYLRVVVVPFATSRCFSVSVWRRVPRHPRRATVFVLAA